MDELSTHKLPLRRQSSDSQPLVIHIPSPEKKSEETAHESQLTMDQLKRNESEGVYVSYDEALHPGAHPKQMLQSAPADDDDIEEIDPAEPQARRKRGKSLYSAYS